MNHFYKSIPGWFSFRGLYEQAVREAKDGAHFVEVGCWKGRSAAFMAVEIINSGKKIRFDCVDTWLGSQEPKHLADESVKNGTLFDEFCRNLEPILGKSPSFPFYQKGMKLNFYIVKAPSVLAAYEYADATLNFVTIDAAHDYENVLADIRAWWPKIKSGGVLAGDDFKFKGVNKAVKEYFSLTEDRPIEVVPGTGTGCAWRVRK